MPENNQLDVLPSDALFSRGPGGDTSELRGDCPKRILQVLDAVAIARDKTRIAIAVEVLEAWTKKVEHEAMLVNRVTGGNPSRAEALGDRA